MDLSGLIRDIEGFPVDGVVYKDISPLLADPAGLAAACKAMAAPFANSSIDKVVAIEARGFLFGPIVAQSLGVGFVAVRKPGKLPADTTKVSYDLEYGSDSIEIHTDSLREGERVLLVDDVLATGGTIEAAAKLVTTLGAEAAGVSVLIELEFLHGRGRLADIETHSVLQVS